MTVTQHDLIAYGVNLCHLYDVIFEDFINSISIIQGYIYHLNLPGMEFAGGFNEQKYKKICY